MPNAISTPSVTVNNIAIAIVPNSVTYTEGLGEQTTRTQSAGGGSVQVVYSQNAESKLSMIRFELINTAENIALIRQWKANTNNNAISITDTGFTRTFTNASINSNYEVNLGSDTTIALEWMSNPAI